MQDVSLNHDETTIEKPNKETKKSVMINMDLWRKHVGLSLILGKNPRDRLEQLLKDDLEYHVDLSLTEPPKK